jgi:hypothetical protein
VFCREVLQVSFGLVLRHLVGKPVEVPLQLLETSNVKYAVFALDSTASLLGMSLEVDEDFIFKLSLSSVEEHI